MEGAPPVAIRQPNVRSKLDEQLDQFEVSILAALMKRSLAVVVVTVHVHLVLQFFEQPLEAASIAVADGLLEDALMGSGRCRLWTPCVDRETSRGPCVDDGGNRRNTLRGEETLRVTLWPWVHGV